MKFTDRSKVAVFSYPVTGKRAMIFIAVIQIFSVQIFTEENNLYYINNNNIMHNYFHDN